VTHAERPGVIDDLDEVAGRSPPVKLTITGGWVELWVDDRDVHATADLSMLPGLLSAPLASGLRQILQHTFRQALP
jgi:hypothetical protein